MSAGILDLEFLILTNKTYTMRLYKMMNVAAVVCVLLGTLAVESAGSMSAAIEVMIWWYGFAAALRGMAYIGTKHEEDVNYKEWKESTKKQ